MLSNDSVDKVRDYTGNDKIPCAFEQYDVFKNGEWQTVYKSVPSDKDRIRWLQATFLLKACGDGGKVREDVELNNGNRLRPLSVKMMLRGFCLGTTLGK